MRSTWSANHPHRSSITASLEHSEVAFLPLSCLLRTRLSISTFVYRLSNRRTRTNVFDVHFTDESYALNAQTIFSGQSSRALFGMGPGTPTDTLDLYLPAQYNDGFFLEAFQRLFSGSVGKPTLIPARFDFLSGTFNIGIGVDYTLANAHVTATAAVPEPPPLALAGTATLLSASCLLFRQRRKRLAPQNRPRPDGDTRWQAQLQIV